MVPQLEKSPFPHINSSVHPRVTYNPAPPFATQVTSFGFYINIYLRRIYQIVNVSLSNLLSTEKLK